MMMTEPESNKVLAAQKILEAADLIEQAPKLAKGAYVNSACYLDDEGYFLPSASSTTGSDFRSCYCVVGAFMHVIGFNRSISTVDTMIGIVGRHLSLTPIPLVWKPYEQALTEWNDRRNQTKEEVVQVLRAAANEVLES